MLCGGLRVDTAEAAEGEPAPEAPARADESGSSARRGESEFTAIPVVGGDSDTGFGGGFIASFARTAPGVEPYRMRIETAGMITFRSEGDQLRTPFLDAYVLYDAPHVIPGELGLKLRASHTHEGGLRYFGLGNASALEPGRSPDDPRYRYDWTHPTFDVALEHQLDSRWELHWGASYTHNRLDVPADGLLAADAAHPDPRIRRLIRVVRDHGVATFRHGVAWDTRDDEVAPQRGQYHSLRLDVSPGAPRGVPFRWARVNLAARGYLGIVRERLTLAVRFVADALLGEPPFYELARYDNTYAVGGGKGVRGIPARRYYGKLKLLSNLELRWTALQFDLWDASYGLGVVGFVDGGRVFADYAALSALDGSGLGIKPGYGGGVRLAAGETFVLRADVATSPDAEKISGYLTAGHIF